MENHIFGKIWQSGLGDQAQAKILEAQAAVNDSYASAMEKCGGADRAPLAYSAHIQAAARRRLQAAKLRGEIVNPIMLDENINLA